MVTTKCPICSENFLNLRLTFAHLLWKHPKDYLRLKRSTTPTDDLLTLMCRKKANVKKKNEVVNDEINQSVEVKKTPNVTTGYVELSLAKPTAVAGPPCGFADRTSVPIPNQCGGVSRKNVADAEKHDVDQPQTSTLGNTVAKNRSQQSIPKVSTQPLSLLPVTTLGPAVLYKCEWCPGVFVSVPAVVNHDVSCHPTIRRFNCFACDLVEHTPVTLVGHIQQCHKDIFSLICNDCKTSFDGADQYYEHVSNEVMHRLFAYYQNRPIYRFPAN